MIGKKINQLATELAPASTDLTIIGNPTTGVSKKITLAQLGAIFSGAVSFYTNYASFPATGTLDVIFCAKDTQKLYLWSGSAYVEVFPSQALLDTYQLRSEKGNANGYASLDSSGKVPVSQLPSSIMEYKGTWSAATNTPTLANGTGDTGDVYICNAAGSVNFGAGSITFAVGDYVIYSGSIWQRSSGAVGTVTSIAASITGNAIGITGSPVTTSGTLAFAFAGTGAQYIKGDGTLATFPSIISQAQNLVTEVYNSTGATLTKGTVVYINGGQGNLPTVTKAIATGDSTSAQTYGIVQADITNMNNGYVVVAGRLLDIDTQAYSIGTQLYLSSTTAGAYTSTKQYAPNHLVYVGIIVRSHPTQGVIEVKIQNGYELDELHNVSAQTPTNNDGLFWEASTSLWKNKSLATIIGGTPAYGSGTQNRITKFTANAGELIDSNIHDTGSVIYNNNPTNGQFAWQFNGSQTTGLSYGALIVAGTNASDIALRIQNASSTSEYFFVWGDGRVQINNIPNATTDTDRFLVSDSGVIKYRTGTQLLSDIGGQPAGTYVTSVGLSAPTGFAVSGSPVTSTGTLALSFATGYSLPTNASQTNWDTAYTNRITSATSPLSITSNVISIAQASGSTSGYLSSTDWTTFNNKQNALTNPVTGTGTTNYLPKFTGTSTIGNSIVSESGAALSVAGSIGISGNYPIILNSVSGVSSQQLQYQNNGTNKWQLYLDTSNNSFNFYSSANTANRLTLTESGNLGLGVSPSAWDTSTNVRVLQMNAGSLWGFSTTAFLMVQNSFSNTSGVRTYVNNGFASEYEQASGQHIWKTAPSGTAGNAISFTQAMTLDASGRLGIGTTSPTTNLQVYQTGGAGNNYVEGTIQVGGTSSTLGGAFSYAAQSSGFVNITNLNNGGGANSRISFGFGAITSGLPANNVMTINQSGSVGIGTTSPVTKLTINNGGANTSTNYEFKNISVTSGFFSGYTANAIQSLLAGYDTNSIYGTDIGYGYDGTGYTLMFSTNDNTSGNPIERMRITSGGDVAIGDTSSSARLWARRTDDGNTFGVRATNASYSATVGFFGADRNTTNNSFYYIDCYNYGSSSYRFRVADSGNVTNANNSYGGISDITLKENISDTTSKLADLLKVKVRNYNLIGDDKKQIGVIAQELETIFPSMIDTDKETGLKSVKYSVFVPMLIKAIQELNDKIK